MEMTHYEIATSAELLPIRNQPARFAIGDPGGSTSNSWRVWNARSGVYVACRDNAKETKVSLHTGGRWRMGFTTEGFAKIAHLGPRGANRAWEVWNEPPPAIPGGVVAAFKLVFPTPELRVRPDQRNTRDRERVIYVEAAPAGRMVVASLFVTPVGIILTPVSEPSFLLASFDMEDGRLAQLVVHGEPEGELPAIIEKTVARALMQASFKGVSLPEQAYGYFLGRMPNGCRYLFGARIMRQPGQTPAGRAT